MGKTGNQLPEGRESRMCNGPCAPSQSIEVRVEELIDYRHLAPASQSGTRILGGKRKKGIKRGGKKDLRGLSKAIELRMASVERKKGDN